VKSPLASLCARQQFPSNWGRLAASTARFPEVFALSLSLFHHNDRIFWCFPLAYEAGGRKMKLFVTVTEHQSFPGFSVYIHTNAKKPLKRRWFMNLYNPRSQSICNEVRKQKKEGKAGRCDRTLGRWQSPTRLHWRRSVHSLRTPVLTNRLMSETHFRLHMLLQVLLLPSHRWWICPCKHRPSPVTNRFLSRTAWKLIWGGCSFPEWQATMFPCITSKLRYCNLL
jgi:hypothetical protein